MHIDFLLDSFQNNLEKEAIIWKEKLFNYQWILDRVHFWQKKIYKENISPGKYTGLHFWRRTQMR